MTIISLIHGNPSRYVWNPAHHALRTKEPYQMDTFVDAFTAAVAASISARKSTRKRCSIMGFAGDVHAEGAD